jgi:hypothetical protein
MVRSGIRSLDIACARTSGESFRQSMSRHSRFLSALLRSGCSYTRAGNQIRSIDQTRWYHENASIRCS